MHGLIRPATRRFRQTIRLLWRQDKIRPVKFQTKQANRVLLIFHLDSQIIRLANHFPGDIQNVQKFLRGKTMVMVIGLLKLQIDPRFLALNAAAINKMPGYKPGFGNMKMAGNIGAIWQFEIYRG